MRTIFSMRGADRSNLFEALYLMCIHRGVLILSSNHLLVSGDVTAVLCGWAGVCTGCCAGVVICACVGTIYPGGGIEPADIG